MITVSYASASRIAITSLATLLFSLASAQPPDNALLDPNTQADYVIITAEDYVPVMEPLASFREQHNNFSVVTITTEAIENIFGQGIPPDSGVREFVTYALTTWEDPKPQFFLLGGSVNAVPSHKEPGLEFIGEDSVLIDQWFVEGVPDTMGYIRPAAAIGRLPGWDASQLSTMIDKTIAYESMSDSAWNATSISVADYSQDVGSIFEDQARAAQEILASIWSDTVTVHVREDSPFHLTREQFRALVNQGASLVSLVGYHEWYFFSESRYFTTWDADSLSNTNRLPFWLFSSSMRFEKEDTLSMATNLMLLPDKGAVGALGPTGHTFATSHFSFLANLLEEMVGDPAVGIGTSIMNLKRRDYRTGSRTSRIIGLLADPSLVIRTGLVTGFDHDAPTLPSETHLFQNYPNPFNPTTTFSFSIPYSSFTILSVYDLLGREVATLVNERLGPGSYTKEWDATRQASGVYFYRLKAGDHVATKKLVLMR